MKMSAHFLSLAHLSRAEFLRIVARAVVIAEHPEKAKNLVGSFIGMYFRKTSTRTRTSFAIGAMKMGAGLITYGPNDLQVSTGESLHDTARVLSGYLDALVVRTADDPRELQVMAAAGGLSIINAMTSDEHPTQALSDFATLKRRFSRLEGLKLLYLGEGNNTAAALALAASRCPGFEATFLTPKGYGIPPHLLETAQTMARDCGASVLEAHDLQAVQGPMDVVYTTRWQTTGTVKNDEFWREKFAPFRVTESLMRAVSRPTGTVFMHDLPAVRGEDCDSSVLDGPQSIAFEQARQKLYSAMAVLEWCLE
ncbi:MAG: ornithine carbamoyltransferase [Verrucomicrobia bacterium]|nr:ornithine carbamoyltransferase [Verrucomicrobiota bacterium]